MSGLGIGGAGGSAGDCDNVLLGSGLSVVALSTDDTARPNAPGSVTRCRACGDGSGAGLCQLWVLGPSIAAVRLAAFVSLSWRKASLAQMWVVGLCASMRIATASFPMFHVQLYGASCLPQ